MMNLLTALGPEIKKLLPYLKWADVLDDELLPNFAAGFPQVGLLDGGTEERSLTGKRDIEVLTVFAVVYQQIIADAPGAAVMGRKEQLGDAGKGVLAIAKDLKAALNDNFLNQNFYFAHLERQDASAGISNPEETDLAVMKKLTFAYRRMV